MLVTALLVAHTRIKCTLCSHLTLRLPYTLFCSVIAVCFSGNVHGSPEKKGGDVLVTVTADNQHSIHVWLWMTNANVFCKAVNIPCWSFKPEKKLEWLKGVGEGFRALASPTFL